MMAKRWGRPCDVASDLFVSRQNVSPALAVRISSRAVEVPEMSEAQTSGAGVRAAG